MFRYTLDHDSTRPLLAPTSAGPSGGAGHTKPEKCPKAHFEEQLCALRKQIVGHDRRLSTPLSKKTGFRPPLVYADFTASGRALQSVEGMMK